MSGVGPLPCSKRRPETGTSDLGGGRRAFAAEQHEGSDPEGAAGETYATQIELVKLKYFAPIIFLGISFSLTPVTAVCKE